MGTPPAPETNRPVSWTISVIAAIAVVVALVVTFLVVVHDRGSNLATASPTPAASGPTGVITDNAGAFTIDFPGPAPTPIVTTIHDPAGDRPDTVYQTSDGFAAGWTVLPAGTDLSNPDARLRTAMAAQVKSVSGTPLGPATSKTVQGQPALTFTIVVSAGGTPAYLRTLLVLRDHYLYTVEVLGASRGVPAFDTFAATFRLGTEAPAVAPSGRPTSSPTA